MDAGISATLIPFTHCNRRARSDRRSVQGNAIRNAQPNPR